MSDLRPVPRNRRSEQRAAQTGWNARPTARRVAPRHPPKREEPPTQREKPAQKAERPKTHFPGKTVLLLMLLTLIAFLAMTGTRGRLRELRRQRAEEAEQYEKLVARHIVNETRSWIEKYSAQNGIEPAFAAAVILRESSYNPMATSSVGARGLMQLMPDTFEQVRAQLRESTTFADMYDPETNIRYGCWYLGYLSRIFDGDPIEIACAYHAGPNNVKLWIMNYAADQQNLQLDEIPMEDTRYYAGKVYDAYSIYFQHFYPDPA